MKTGNQPHENLPRSDLLRVLIFGRSLSVWEEVDEALSLGAYNAVIAVGRAGRDFNGDIDHWVSFHPSEMAMWRREREAAGKSPAGQFWTANFRGKLLGRNSGLSPLSRVNCNGGSSGMIALTVAFEALRADKIVLAGIPMTATGGQYDTRGQWAEANKYREPWEKLSEDQKERVRSMSGWTQEQFGSPTKEWLRGVE